MSENTNMFGFGVNSNVPTHGGVFFILGLFSKIQRLV